MTDNLARRNLSIWPIMWGIGGVLLLLVFAVVRLSPKALEALGSGLSWQQWLIAAGWCAYMVYSEGYKAFQLHFAPKVVRRGLQLSRQAPKQPKTHLLLAPLYCMGHIGSSRRQMAIVWSATFAIIGLVIAVRLLPQPWRGIADLGVVLGLSYGVVCIILETFKAKQST